MELTDRQIENLYDRCTNVKKNHPDCEIFQENDRILLKGSLPEIDGYITVEFNPSSISIES